MSKPRLFVCGNAIVDDDDERCIGRQVKALTTFGPDANVNFLVEQLCFRFLEQIGDRIADLLDIAAYVYAADCSTDRSNTKIDTEKVRTWRRDFRFIIPVKDLEFWSSQIITQQLTQLLGRLSNDSFKFDFVGKPSEQREQVLQFGEDADWLFMRPERVILFSGGLDSLAGVIETAASGKRLVLVSHRSAAITLRRQCDLLQKLKNAYPAVDLLHVPVALNLCGQLKSIEPTQRTRSFLFACLAAAVAKSTDAEGIRFFENGVVSTNLPVADEVVGARASRTTHPRTLYDFQEFLSTVLSKEIIVDNPFIWNTKKDIVEKIVSSKDPTMIGISRSCVHNRYIPRTAWHCGTCSQCIDRRIAIVAANAESFDDAQDYEIDVFAGPRKAAYEQNIAIDYIRLGRDLGRLGADGIASQFADEIMEANRFLGRSRESAERLCGVLAEHGRIVNNVIASQITKHANRFLEGDLPSSCLIRLVAENKHAIDRWRRYAESVIDCLREGLPTACGNPGPKTEPDLQRICDALLKSAGYRLQREFPLERWGLIGHKPDWSESEINLWIELKYARKQSAPPGRISDEIAADITKYGSAGKRVLFVIFDPNRLIKDDATFIEPIISNPYMLAVVLR